MLLCDDSTVVTEGTQCSIRAAALRKVLESAPGSSPRLVGSLGSGSFDEFSDIDLRWRVGDVAAKVMSQIGEILHRVDPVALLRFDPSSDRSSDRRILFVRFAGWPLFWRVDLEIFGDFSAVDPVAAWSAQESALMNVIGALKAHRRGQPERADGLLRRGFDRLAVDDPGGQPLTRMLALTRQAGNQAPHCATFASEIVEAIRSCQER
jgi:hypothetical protein